MYSEDFNCWFVVSSSVEISLFDFDQQRSDYLYIKQVLKISKVAPNDLPIIRADLWLGD